MSDARTEPASPRRLADAQRAGVRPVSRDAVSFVVVASAGWLIVASLTSFGLAWQRLLTTAIDATSQPGLDPAAFLPLVEGLFRSLLPVALLILVMTSLVWAAQGGLGFRSLSARARVHVRPLRVPRTLWSIVKATVVAMAFASIVHHSLHALLTTPTSDIPFALRTLERLSWLAASRLGIALSLLVIADLLVQHLLWRESLRMTREELRRELRESEVDPSLRAEQRRQHRAATPESTP